MKSGQILKLYYKIGVPSDLKDDARNKKLSLEVSKWLRDLYINGNRGDVSKVFSDSRDLGDIHDFKMMRVMLGDGETLNDIRKIESKDDFIEWHDKNLVNKIISFEKQIKKEKSKCKK